METVRIIKTCIDCGKSKSFTLDKSKYDLWCSGAVIQRCFPEIPADDRELLMTSRCGECFDSLFSEEE